MAHFYSTIQGNKGEASRCGTKNSGMRCIANGWDIGADVQLVHRDNDEAVDIVDIRVTGGSNGSKNYGEVRARQIDATDVLVEVNRVLLDNCDPEVLSATIMECPELVKHLRAHIFLTGQAAAA